MGVGRAMGPAWGAMDDDANPEPNVPDAAARPVAEDLEALARYAEALADGVQAALPGWVERSVERVHVEKLLRRPPADVREAATSAGLAAAADVGGRVHALLALDIDEQRTGPLALVRQAVPYPTEVLRAAGVPPGRTVTSSPPGSSPTTSTTWRRRRSASSTPTSRRSGWCGARPRPTCTSPAAGPTASADPANWRSCRARGLRSRHGRATGRDRW